MRLLTKSTRQHVGVGACHWWPPVSAPVACMQPCYSLPRDLQFTCSTTAATTRRLGHMQDPSCPVCLDVCVRAVTTPCGHTLCSACLYKTLLADSLRRCPECRQPVALGGVLYHHSPFCYTCTYAAM